MRRLTNAASAARAASAAWLLQGALAEVLVFQLVNEYGLAGEARSVAVMLSAFEVATSLLLAALLLANATRRRLAISCSWALITVAVHAGSVALGAVDPVYLASTLTAGLAGVFSFVGWWRQDGPASDGARRPALGRRTRRTHDTGHSGQPPASISRSQGSTIRIPDLSCGAPVS